MAGWIKIYRSSFDNKMYFSEPFTKWQAWIDLLLLANHKENIIKKRGISVVIKKGQVGHSVRNLAKRWSWSRGKVSRFLQELKNEGQIEPQKNNITSLISITNYIEYQIGEPKKQPMSHKKKHLNQTKTNSYNECNKKNGPQTGHRIFPISQIGGPQIEPQKKNITNSESIENGNVPDLDEPQNGPQNFLENPEIRDRTRSTLYNYSIVRISEKKQKNEKSIGSLNSGEDIYSKRYGGSLPKHEGCKEVDNSGKG